MNITFIFGRCRRNLAAVTPANYENDLQDLTVIFANWKNVPKGPINRVLVTPTRYRSSHKKTDSAPLLLFSSNALFNRTSAECMQYKHKKSRHAHHSTDRQGYCTSMI